MASRCDAALEPERPRDAHTERELVQAARAGDADTFSDLAEARVSKMFAVARLILRDGAAVDDATQDGLVMAWRDLHALRDPDRLDAWLHRVLVHTCYRASQRSRRRIEVEGQIQPINEPRDPGDQSVLKDELERGFARLSVEHRTVLVLHHYLGYTRCTSTFAWVQARNAPEHT
jgi:RNA polymerase sigma factor (sigma-70 family)